MAGYEPLSRAELLSLLAERDSRIAQLEAENAGLARRVAVLERLISRNSGNSSMPPSADDQPGRTAPREKPRRGSGKRKPGKQPGAPGALAWSEDPDDTVDHFPEGTCECGARLEDARTSACYFLGDRSLDTFAAFVFPDLSGRSGARPVPGLRQVPRADPPALRPAPPA
ncbi:MAG TPA: DUF6444 domain-containing protein [Streptosporangiaceae bacterium]|nr:DUF6444 domain-containing protein [Streptosporangiaceae bacterium]